MAEPAAEAHANDNGQAGRGSTAHAGPPVIGLNIAHGRVGADVISDREAVPIRHALGPRRSRTHPLPFSLPGYAAVVYRGRFHRLETDGDPSPGFGRIEGFWGYLQRQLRAKGGVRRERLPLYIAEYVWRYNHRRLSPAEQVRELFTLMRQAAGGTSRTFGSIKRPSRVTGISRTHLCS